MSHAEIIESLGGAPTVARALGTDADRVYQWKRAGVAWKWRPKFADLAASRGVTLPDGFFDPERDNQAARRPRPRRAAKKRQQKAA